MTGLGQTDPHVLLAGGGIPAQCQQAGLLRTAEIDAD